MKTTTFFEANKLTDINMSNIGLFLVTINFFFFLKERAGMQGACLVLLTLTLVMVGSSGSKYLAEMEKTKRERRRDYSHWTAGPQATSVARPEPL